MCIFVTCVINLLYLNACLLNAVIRVVTYVTQHSLNFTFKRQQENWDENIPSKCLPQRHLCARFRPNNDICIYLALAARVFNGYELTFPPPESARQAQETCTGNACSIQRIDAAKSNQHPRPFRNIAAK